MTGEEGKTMRKKGYVAIVVFLCCLLAVLPASAAKKKNGWYQAENGKTYYYQNGKIARGFVRIQNKKTKKKKTCYFNKKGKLIKNRWFLVKGNKYRADRNGTVQQNKFFRVGKQVYYASREGKVLKSWKTLQGKRYYFGADGARRTGVQKIHGKTYFFDSRGVLMSGIQEKGGATYYLSDKGVVEAKVQNGSVTDAEGKRLPDQKVWYYEAYTNARKVVLEITDPSMSQEEKLLACFRWVMRKPYITHRKFVKFDGWPAYYANDHFIRGGGNCEADASAFAYLAKVLGYENIYVCADSDGVGLPHSWAEINGLVYDPLFAEAKSFSDHYGVPYGRYILHPIQHIAI